MDEREARFSLAHDAVIIHVCYAPADDCQNLRETYGMVCVKCGRCGREFDEAGVLVGKRKRAKTRGARRGKA